ncbi:MAG: bi-domain-containing oxidoreductase [Candidatus Omnitrophica bacterium]|nr:bi-domain-containing oxidoreductase [Candidatus Omnitrophota bacterium]
MKQVIQNYKTGKLKISDVAVPLCGRGKVLVKNHASLISSGTERSILELGRKSLIGKAKARPEHFKRFIEKAKNEGFLKVWKEAMVRLDEAKPLGYSSSGEVIQTGEGVSNFKVGDKVACIGANHATHSEIIALPECLCAKIPGQVSFEEASFGMLGIIALQGVRLAEIKIGEKVAVLGLGLLGQITVQLLKYFGCNVIGIDLDEDKLKLARSLDCDQAVLIKDAGRAVENFSQGKGVDKIIITAASKTNLPIMLASEIASFRAKIILVGVVDIHIPRQIFWEKELEFQVSKAGGYNPLEKEFDYPESYKSVSQLENLKLFLELINKGQVQVAPLITHKFSIANALQAYQMITAKKPQAKYIGVILQYDEQEVPQKRIIEVSCPVLKKNNMHSIGVIGAGLFGRSVILPALKSVKHIKFLGVATANSNTGRQIADSFKFEYCTTDYAQILNDKAIKSVFILTRHNLHAKIIKEALEAGKCVFAEKPLATTLSDLKMLSSVTTAKEARLMVGFNRRFSPLAVEIKKRILNNHGPLLINMQINAGDVPKGHWVFDEQEGGGRIISEICHFVDLAQFFTGANPESVFTQNIEINNTKICPYDNTVSVIKFSDGSVCNILYTSIGNRAYAREKISIFENNAVYEISDFRSALVRAPGASHSWKLSSQGLGYKEEMKFFFKNMVNSRILNGLTAGYLLTTLTTFKMIESLKTGQVCKFSVKDLQ